MIITRKYKKSFEATKNDTVEFFINNKKTNLWYRLKNYKYYNQESKEERKEKRKKIINILKLIRDEKIIVDYNFNIDDCLHTPFNFKSISIINYKSDYIYILCSVTHYGRYKNSNEVLEQVKKEYSQEKQVQLCNILNNNGTLRQNIGIYCEKYGYTIYSI